MYIDGVLIPKENIKTIEVTPKGVILVELVYDDKKEHIKTDSKIRKIELRDGT